MPDDQAVFTPQIVRNRQSLALYAALDAIVPSWPPTAGGGAGTGGKTEEKTLKADSGQGSIRTGVMKSGGRGGGGAEGGCREGGEREDGGASDALARAISARLRHLRATRRTGNGHGNTGNGHAPSDDVSNDALPPPGPGSIVVSNDRWCVYPPALGKPNRKTDNPPVHLDICPWTYVSTGIFFSYQYQTIQYLFQLRS